MQALQETLSRLSPVRWTAGAVMLGRYALQRGRSQYRALDAACWVSRVAAAEPFKRLADDAVRDVVRRIRHAGRNVLAESYHADPRCAALAASYLQSGGGPHDLLRDLMVLKPASDREKGVILLKYVRTFDAVQALLDVSRLMQRYTFVLEPCWAGYCDPSLLMWLVPGQPVIVQCFTDEDARFVDEIGPPLVAVRLGPADWVDADLFKPRPSAAKRYDLVMVANWGRHKRHAQLFRALRQIRGRQLKVLLIGFPWADRTAEDIRREAAGLQGTSVEVDIVESLPAREVAERVSECRAFVFLSRKEGDNKALVEAMFADVPAIVYDRSIGGARSRINRATGVLASDERLAEQIVHMLDHHAEFTPREWALAHTGSAIATRVLDQTLRSVVTAAGGRYSQPIVQKTNSPNLAYKEPGIRERFEADYEFVLSCRRQPPARSRAVA
jgi:glycosyltransferase involved in cell wall biosynthesis